MKNKSLALAAHIEAVSTLAIPAATTRGAEEISHQSLGPSHPLSSPRVDGGRIKRKLTAVLVALGLMALSVPAGADHGHEEVNHHAVVAANDVSSICGGDVPHVKAYLDQTISATGNAHDAVEAAVNEWNSISSCGGSGTGGDSPYINLQTGSHTVSFNWGSRQVTVDGNTYTDKNILIFSKGSTDWDGSSWDHWTTENPAGVYDYETGVSNSVGPSQPAVGIVKFNTNPNNSAGTAIPASDEIDVFGTVVHEIGHYMWGTDEHLNEWDLDTLCPKFNFTGDPDDDPPYEYAWDSDRSTMCNGTHVVYGKYSGRTLDAHDESITAGIYPN